MYPYCFFFIALFICSLISLWISKNETSHYWKWNIVLIFFLFIGLRNSGYDFNTYEGLYNVIRSDYLLGINILKENPTKMELGFRILCALSSNFRILLLLMALLVSLTSINLVVNRSVMPFFSLLLLSSTLLLPTYMGQMRQGVAIGFVMCAVYFFIEQKKIYAFLFVLIGMTFHLSALLGFLIFVIPDRKYSLWIYLFLLLISLGVGSFADSLAVRLFRYMPTDAFFTDKYEGNMVWQSQGRVFLTTLLERLFVFFLGFVVVNKNNYKGYTLMLNLYFFSILMYLGLGILPAFRERGFLYFNSLWIFLLPMVCMNLRNYRFWYGAIIIVFVILSAIRLIAFFNDPLIRASYVPYG